MRSRPLAWVFVTSLGAAGCDAAEPSPPSRAGSPLVDPSVVEASSPATVARPVAKSLEVARIAWPAPDSVDVGALEGLSNDARLAVLRSRVPVLVPARAELLRRAIVMPDTHYTAIAFPTQDREDGLTVSLQANRVAHRYPAVPAAIGRDVVRGRDAWVTQNEGIWSATWIEHGVSYVLEVECARPSEDARCASDAYVRALAEELVFVGGAFEEGGAR